MNTSTPLSKWFRCGASSFARKTLLIMGITFSVFASGTTALGDGGMIIPAYFYPTNGGNGDRFQQVAWAAQWLSENGSEGYDEVIAIINVADGPGVLFDSNYASAIEVMQNCGVKVIGYVATGYGANSWEDITTDIDLWRSLYPSLDGIFLDEWNGQQKVHSNLYRNLHKYVVGQSDMKYCIANPGVKFHPRARTPKPAEWATQFVLHENTFAASQDYEIPRWASTRPFSLKAAVMIHTMPNTGDETADQVDATLRVLDAKSKGARWIYVTEDVLDNPWDTLPGETATGISNDWNPYWGNLVWSIGLAHP